MSAPIVKSRRQHLRLSVNSALIDKIAPTDKKSWSHGFETHELTIEELAKTVCELGYAFSYVFEGGVRKTENFLGADFLAVDVDGAQTIEHALKNRWVSKYCSLLYTTASHKPESPRFRLVFVLPKTITDPNELKAASLSLARRCGGDLSATDAARMFYGAMYCRTILLGKKLNQLSVDQLISDGRVVSASDSVANLSRRVTSRSALRISPTDTFKTADKKWVRIGDVKKKVSVYCPYHPDNNPSAFIAVSPKGATFFRCSACQLTRFQEGKEAEGYDFNSFEKAIIDLKNNESGAKTAELSIFKRYQSLVIPARKQNRYHFSSDRYIDLKNILPGITLIKSPKGSGKTYYLIDALKKVLFYHGINALKLDYLEKLDPDEPIYSNKRVLLIGHRQALIRELCQRLGLNCYLDDPVTRHEKNADRPAKYVSAPHKPNLDRYGVCLDSLWRIEDQVYDIVIIDESEQVLAHFLSDTIGEGRYELFEKFKKLITSTKSVVALDADLGWTTANTLLALWSKKVKQTEDTRNLSIYINTWRNEGEEIYIYPTKGQLIDAMKQALLRKERVFVASNSKTRIKNLSESIGEFSKIAKLQFKTLTITSENSKTEDIQKFITQIKTKVLDYDVILASPSLGTGVDITFENNRKEIDSVFGIFENQINTHTEIDQQLARVRHPKSVHVWVSPERFNFETDLQVAQEDFLDNNFNASSYVKSTTTKHEAPIMTMVASIVAFQRASKNNFKANFLNYKTEAGWKVIELPNNETSKGAGNSFIKLGLKIAKQKDVDAIVHAKEFTDEQLEDFLTRWSSNHHTVSIDERCSYYRGLIEEFYAQNVTADLVKLDDKGRFREKLRTFEEISSIPTIERLIAEKVKASEKQGDRYRTESLMHSSSSRTILIYEILEKTPYFKRGKFNTNVVFDQSDLLKFVDFVIKMKQLIETQLDIAVPRNVRQKSVQMMSKVLKSVGLTHWRFRPVTKNGVKTYSYKVCPKRLALVMNICRDRSTTNGGSFL